MLCVTLCSPGLNCVVYDSVTEIDLIIPFLLYLCSRSHLEGISPPRKNEQSFPYSKEPNLDPNLCQNYRPISNLSFLPRLLNDWFRCSSSLTSSSQASSFQLIR